MKDFKCPCCLFDMMKVRLDKKGRPFFQCFSCGTIIFARLGDVGIHTVANVLTALAGSQETVTQARAEALRTAEQPGSVMALLSSQYSVSGESASPGSVVKANGANGASRAA